MAEYQVAILYGQVMGFEDIRAVADHLAMGFSRSFYLFVKKPLAGKASESVEKLLTCEVILSENPRKEAKAFYKKKKAEGMKSYISSSDEFGYRGMASDPL